MIVSALVLVPLLAGDGFAGDRGVDPPLVPGGVIGGLASGPVVDDPGEPDGQGSAVDHFADGARAGAPVRLPRLAGNAVCNPRVKVCED